MSQQQLEINAYLAQLTPMELKVLEIAKSHLVSSFSLLKSVGFIEWKKAQKLAPAHELHLKPLIGKL
jgi:hypothetical protein